MRSALVLAVAVAACSSAPRPSARDRSSPPPPLAAAPRVAPAPSVDPAVVLAKSPGTSLVGLWRRRLAAAWTETHDAAAPEVRAPAAALDRNVRWLSLDDEAAMLQSLVPLAPVFEDNRVPIGLDAGIGFDATVDYRERERAAAARRLPGRIAIYEKLGARGRRKMFFAVRDHETADALLGVTARDGVCPSLPDDRDLGWEVWSRPLAARCLPPPLPDDELRDLERLSADLAGPWPRAVRALAALRDMRDRNRGGFTPTLAQQKRFLEGCMIHPMCPLFLLDTPDAGLKPALEEARSRATPSQKDDIDQALASIAGKREPDPPPPETIARCVDAITKELAGSRGEPWMREARAADLRWTCLRNVERVERKALVPLVAKADVVTAAILLEALVSRAGPLPAEEVKRVAADLRTRTKLFRALHHAGLARLMPAEWAKEDALVDAEAYEWIAPTYGDVPDKIERTPTTVKYRGKTAKVVYVTMSANGDYAGVPPIVVAVGPIFPGPPQTYHDLTGTEWGTSKEGLRAFVEKNMNEDRSVRLFDNFE